MLLSCDGLAKSFGHRVLFEGLTLSVLEGQRLGVIGPNGSGKSTLLKILAGLEAPDAGAVTLRRQARCRYVPQQDTFSPDATAESAVLEGLSDSAYDDHERHTRCSLLLEGLGLDDPQRPVSALSGGWRKRLAIARALVSEPDLLLLDEPTNHLDIDGIEWLERLLCERGSSSVVISHDRVFLERVATRVVELNRAFVGGALNVGGSYSDFVEKRSELLANAAAQESSLQGRLRRELQWLKQNAKARTTKAKGRIDEAQRMSASLSELQTRNSQDRRAAIGFDASGRKTVELIRADGLTRSLGGRELFRSLSLLLSPGTRLGLLGPNGSGKSSLIRLLIGQDRPDAGDVRHADDLQVVWFDQSREQLDPTQSLRAALQPSANDQVMFRGQPIHVAGWARRFLFRPEQLDMDVGHLSGGEQARVLIARLMLKPADVLILDEPTNDLDIPSLEVLEESLTEFAGAVVLVTHDRYMLGRVSTQILALDGEGGAELFADYDQWQMHQQARAERALQAARASASARQRSEKPSQSASGTSSATAGPTAPKPRKLSYREQKELDGMEEAIQTAEARLAEIQAQLEEPAVVCDYQAVARWSDELSKQSALVESLYARWAELDARKGS